MSSSLITSLFCMLYLNIFDLLMPQLDKIAYISELFWLILFFLFFYFFLVYFFLPSIFVSLKYRQYKLIRLSTIQPGINDSKNIVLGYNSYIFSVIKQYYVYQNDILNKINQQVLDTANIDLFLKVIFSDLSNSFTHSIVRSSVLSQLKKK